MNMNCDLGLTSFKAIFSQICIQLSKWVNIVYDHGQYDTLFLKLYENNIYILK